MAADPTSTCAAFRLAHLAARVLARSVRTIEFAPDLLLDDLDGSEELWDPETV